MSSNILMRGAEIPPFYAGEIGRRGIARMRAGLPLITMHFGQPSASAPDAAIREAHQRLDQDSLGYFESAELTEKLSQHYQDTYGVTVNPGRILLTSGASAALVAAFTTLFRPGDQIALLRPGYPAYRNTLRALNLEPVEIDCGPECGFKANPDHLSSLPQTPQGFILASPANPTGAMLDSAALREIAKYCSTHNITLISDEIYHGITYGQDATCALQHDPNVIVINSFSKLYRMPGWRLGWMVVPEGWAARVGAHLLNMFLTPPTLAQHAAAKAMDVNEDLAAAVAMYQRNRNRLYQGLQALGITEITLPEGAFYLYANVAHLTSDSLDFCLRAVDEIGLAMAPGIDFDPVHGHHFIRLSFAVSEAEIDTALELLAGWLP